MINPGKDSNVILDPYTHNTPLCARTPHCRVHTMPLCARTPCRVCAHHVVCMHTTPSCACTWCHVCTHHAMVCISVKSHSKVMWPLISANQKAPFSQISDLVRNCEISPKIFSPFKEQSFYNSSANKKSRNFMQSCFPFFVYFKCCSDFL